MPSPSASEAMPDILLKTLLTAISDLTRWRVLAELLKGEPLPIYELARRLKVNRNTLSKHVAVLRNCGILWIGYGSLYRIAPAYLVPGQRALDFGAVVLRLDRLEHRPASA